MIGVTLSEDNSVNFYHAMPFDENYGIKMTKEEAEAKGWKFFDKAPTPENNGKVTLLMYDPEKGNLYYEYRDPQPEPGEEVEQLRKELAEANVKVDRLTAADLDNKEMIYGLAAMLMGE